jgi:hypothetical protein
VVTGAPRALIEAVWLAIWEIEHTSSKRRSHGMPPRTPTIQSTPAGASNASQEGKPRRSKA